MEEEKVREGEGGKIGGKLESMEKFLGTRKLEEKAMFMRASKRK